MFDDISRTTGFLAGSQRGLMVTPIMDVREDDNDLCVSELPGVIISDLDDRDLLSSAAKKSESVEQRGNVRIAERSYGRFQRTVQLPFRADPKQVNARFDNGVLEVKLAKPADPEGRNRIKVRDSDEQQRLSRQDASGGQQASAEANGSTAQEGTAPGTRASA